MPKITKATDYVAVEKFPFKDPFLSLRAKGLLITIFCIDPPDPMPDGFLYECCFDDDDDIRGALDELMEHGYIDEEDSEGLE